MVPANIAVCSAHILNCIFLVESKMKEVAIATCSLGIFNIVLACILLATMDNPAGAGIAWSVAIMLLNAVFLPLYASKIMDIGRFTFLRPLIVCYAVFLMLVGLGYLLTDNWVMPNSFLWIVVTAGAGFIVYFIAIFFLLLDRHEKGIVLSYFPQSLQKMVLRFVH